jgi:hypothetical protein
MQADRLLGPEVSDVDGNKEERGDTVFVFNGPPPKIESFKTKEKECEGVAAWLKQQTESGIQPHEIGVFVRSEAQLERAQAAIDEACLSWKVLDEHEETLKGLRLPLLLGGKYSKLRGG